LNIVGTFPDRHAIEPLLGFSGVHPVSVWRRQMSPEEKERMQYLCQRIATEEDPQIFDQLVIELNDLLEVKHVRIHPEHKIKPD
jgi:hypothetical protein